MTEENGESHEIRHRREIESLDLLPYLHSYSGGRSGVSRQETAGDTGAEVSTLRLVARCGTGHSVPGSGLRISCFTGCARTSILGYSECGHETETTTQIRPGCSSRNTGEGQTLFVQRPVEEGPEVHRLWGRDGVRHAGTTVLGLPPPEDQRLAG